MTPKPLTTVTVTGGHYIEQGDTIEMLVPDTRWWVRFLHFIFLQAPPVKTERFVVKQVSQTTLTL